MLSTLSEFDSRYNFYQSFTTSDGFETYMEHLSELETKCPEFLKLLRIPKIGDDSKLDILNIYHETWAMLMDFMAYKINKFTDKELADPTLRRENCETLANAFRTYVQYFQMHY